MKNVFWKLMGVVSGVFMSACCVETALAEEAIQASVTASFFEGGDVATNELLLFEYPRRTVPAGRVDPLRLPVQESGVANARVSRDGVHSVDRVSSVELVVVDRIDGGQAILETRAGQVRFPVEALPGGAAHEGAVIEWKNSRKEEKARLSGAQRRIERMREMSSAFVMNGI